MDAIKEASEFIEELYAENMNLRKQINEYEKKASENAKIETTKKIASVFSLNDEEETAMRNWSDSDLKSVENFTRSFGAGNQGFGKIASSSTSASNQYEYAKQEALNFLNSRS